MQMDWMRVVGLTIKDQTVPLTFLKCTWSRLLIKAGAVDCPSIESAFAAIDLPEHKRNRFINLL
jgi:hypothetical protein